MERLLFYIYLSYFTKLFRYKKSRHNNLQYKQVHHYRPFHMLIFIKYLHVLNKI